MIKRLLAIGFIFCCTAVAWFTLAGVTTNRTYSADQNLRHQVERIWGAPQVQQAPVVVASEWRRNKVESLEEGDTVRADAGNSEGKME